MEPRSKRRFLLKQDQIAPQNGQPRNPTDHVRDQLRKARLLHAARLCQRYELEITSFPELASAIRAVYEKRRFHELLQTYAVTGPIGDLTEKHLVEQLVRDGNRAFLLKAAQKTPAEIPSETVLQAVQSRVHDLLKKGALVKAARACRKVGVPPGSIPAINEYVEYALRNKQPQLVLGAFYEAGQFGRHTVDELLHLLAECRMPPAFLKEAYRFGITKGHESEIEDAIRWHRDKGRNDAEAWAVKFASLEPLPSTVPTLGNTNPISVPLVSRLSPVLPGRFDSNTNKSDDAAFDDPYVISRLSRAKMERAGKEHTATLRSLEQNMAVRGCDLANSNLIDLMATAGTWTGIFEVKSITPENERDQVRHAVSQLFEYRFLHKMPAAELFTVFSAEPISGWLVDYLREIGIHVLWIESGAVAGPDLAKLPGALKTAGSGRLL